MKLSYITYSLMQEEKKQIFHDKVIKFKRMNTR